MGSRPRLQFFPYLAPALLLAQLLAGLTAFQTRRARQDLPAKILNGGRVVLSSPYFDFDAADPYRSGHPGLALDGRGDTAAILRMDTSSSDSPYLLADLALTHFPGPSGSPENELRSRLPLRLEIMNGPCESCSLDEFRRYGRARNVRLEFMQRRANDPDVEFIIPPVEPLKTIDLQLPDRPGAFPVRLHLDPPAPAPRYPRNVFYIIVRLNILDQYPGTTFPDRVAVAGLNYVDTDLEAALQGTARPFSWE